MSLPALPTGEYALMELLDLCETALEELDEIGVTTRDDLVKLMDAIHARLDEQETGNQ